MPRSEIITGVLGTLLVVGLTIFYIFRYQAHFSAVQNIFPSPTQTQDRTQSTIPTQLPTKTLTATPTPKQSITLTAAEVQKHNSASDCWIIISNNVYNVTQYLNIHPGGADQIIPYCGKDATAAFQTQGGQGSHSAEADQQLIPLLVGKLGREVSSQTVSVSRRNRIDDD